MDHKPLSEGMIVREARRLYCNMIGNANYDATIPVELDSHHGFYLRVGDQWKQLCSTHLMLSLDDFADQILTPMIKAQVSKEHGSGGKMTRQEAVEKIVNTFPNTASGLVNALEALGLLKFEEERKYSTELLFAINDFRNSHLTHVEFLDRLEKRGYKIVKVTDGANNG